MSLLKDVYDPAIFGQTAARLTQLLREYLVDCQSAPHTALPWRDPIALKARARALLEQAPARLPSELSAEAVADRMALLAREFLESSNQLHSPHYMGHQVPPPLPLAGIFEALGSVTNQASGIYEMGQFPNAVERALTEKLGSYLGWEGRDFDAIVTHGGSAANLTAILAARNARCPGSWQHGLAAAAPGKRPAILCSAESHYSVARAAAIVGLGAEQVIRAPVDSKRRMDVSRLDAVLDQSARDGREVFCVVASACATSTGSFDELEPLGELCRRRGLWLHVDAAHGGGLLLSRKHRDRLRGIEQADSVTWDAHKMMFVPALCTFLFYRDKRHSFQAFDQDAPYLFAKDGNPTLDFDSAVRTLECTKRPAAMALWSMWCLLGPQLFEALVDRTIELAREFHALLSEAPDFEPLHEPECNILCFRYLPASHRGASTEAVSELQGSLRRKLIEAGQFYITATRLDGQLALRVALMNPLTDRSHLEGLMDAIRRTH